MSTSIMKYNPAFLTGDELVKNFVVRQAELDLILQVVQENTGNANQHVLAIGPRGIGKTMLVLRAAEEVRRREDLNGQWYPLVFSEESYRVTTAGEFWHEAIFHIAQQSGDESWRAVYDELQAEKDESRLRERALAQLMDFADAQQKRLLLVVENLNMLLDEQMADDEGWVLRHTLLHEPRVMLLATATSRFEQIDNTGKAMFELFRTIELEALDEDDCRRMWTSISGKESTDGRIRPIQILTGGNPRLVAIISSFGGKMSFRELMGDLMQLVDDHTEYFKSHLDGLPPIERKVYLSLVELWDPSPARKVAENARLDVNRTSSLLKRLRERGAVVEANGKGRSKLYQVAERLYNIYYLMRRHGAPSQRVKAIVNFMVGFYEKKNLLDLIQRLTGEACELPPEARADHYLAYEQILRCSCMDRLRERIMELTPLRFLTAADAPASLRSLIAADAALTHRRAASPGETEAQRRKLMMRGLCLWLQGKPAEAIAHYDATIKGTGNNHDVGRMQLVADAMFGKAQILEEENRHGEAATTYDELIRRFGSCRQAEMQRRVAMAFIHIGIALADCRAYEEAEACFDQVLARFGEVMDSEVQTIAAGALLIKGNMLMKQMEYGGAAGCFRELVERFGENDDEDVKMEVAAALINEGDAFQERGDYSKALASYDEVINRIENASGMCFEIMMASALYHKGVVLTKQEECKQAAEVFRRVLALDPENYDAALVLSSLLEEEGQTQDAFHLLREFLPKPELVKKNVNGTIARLTSLASHGYAADVLSLLRESQSAGLLEPLVVGLRLYLGEDVKAAAEIIEVAKDVVKRIEERRDELAKSPAMKKGHEKRK